MHSVILGAKQLFLALVQSSRQPLNAAWGALFRGKGGEEDHDISPKSSYKNPTLDSKRGGAFTICKARGLRALIRGLTMSRGGANVASFSRT